MYSLCRMGLVAVACAAAMFLSHHTAAQDPKAGPQKYPDVQADIPKHFGKKVSWVGQQVGYQTGTDKEGRKVETYTFLWRDEKGQFFVDHPFVVRGEKLDRTAAAQAADKDPKDKGVRLVSGTVKDSQVFSASNGKTYKAPVLTEVTIDVLKDK